MKDETSVEIQETRYRAVLSETTATWKCGPECGLYYVMGCPGMCRKDCRADGMFAHWVVDRTDRPSDAHNWMKPENYPACMVRCSTANPNCDRAFVRCTAAKPAAQGEGVE